MADAVETASLTNLRINQTPVKLIGSAACYDPPPPAQPYFPHFNAVVLTVP